MHLGRYQSQVNETRLPNSWTFATERSRADIRAIEGSKRSENQNFRSLQREATTLSHDWREASPCFKEWEREIPERLLEGWWQQTPDHRVHFKSYQGILDPWPQLDQEHLLQQHYRRGQNAALRIQSCQTNEFEKAPVGEAAVRSYGQGHHGSWNNLGR